MNWIIICIIVLLPCSCFNNKFAIKLEKHDYKQIHNLIVEIYDKAINNDIDYFRDATNHIFDIENETERIEYWYYQREKHQGKFLNNEEIIEYYSVENIQNLINKIKKANIVKTYKSRARYSNNGINLDYHWSEKDVYFQMYIIRYHKENVQNIDIVIDDIQGWRLDSIWSCR
jgi:hypothetical protein